MVSPFFRHVWPFQAIQSSKFQRSPKISVKNPSTLPCNSFSTIYRRSLPLVQQLLDTMVCYFGGMSLKLCYKLIIVDVALTRVIAGLTLLPSKLHFLTEVGLISNALLLCCIENQFFSPLENQWQISIIKSLKCFLADWQKILCHRFLFRRSSLIYSLISMCISLIVFHFIVNAAHSEMRNMLSPG